MQYAPLYSGVPSRLFFPRGFLCDQGFHNLLISRWDMDISADILAHWMDLMNSEGRIPREQILVKEARTKVLKEFVVQHNRNTSNHLDMFDRPTFGIYGILRFI